MTQYISIYTAIVVTKVWTSNLIKRLNWLMGQFLVETYYNFLSSIANIVQKGTKLNLALKRICRMCDKVLEHQVVSIQSIEK